MRNLLLLPLALLTLYLVPATASAAIESHIPPTERCVQLAKDDLKELLSEKSKVSNPAWNNLVAAGCLSFNPNTVDDSGPDSDPGCPDLRSAGTAYLASSKELIAPAFSRIYDLSKKTTKQLMKLNSRVARLDIANKKPQLQKALKVKIKRVERRAVGKVRVIARANRTQFADAGARFMLVTGDVIANRCTLPDNWLFENWDLFMVGYSLVEPNAVLYLAYYFTPTNSGGTTTLQSITGR